MKVAATRALRRFGFRQVLLVNGAVTTLTILGCAALTPATPYAVIGVVLFAGGLARSCSSAPSTRSASPTCRRRK